jgi:hypothetical protein
MAPSPLVIALLVMCGASHASSVSQKVPQKKWLLAKLCRSILVAWESTMLVREVQCRIVIQFHLYLFFVVCTYE